MVKVLRGEARVVERCGGARSVYPDWGKVGKASLLWTPLGIHVYELDLERDGDLQQLCGQGERAHRQLIVRIATVCYYYAYQLVLDNF